MKWIYILELSIRNLMARKIRSILTVAGVTIGISAITFLVSLGYGLENLITSQIANPKALSIFEVNLEESDIFAISEEYLAKIQNLNNVMRVEKGVTLAGKAGSQSIKTDVIVNILPASYLNLSNPRLLRGEVYKRDDEEKIIASTALLQLLNLSVNDFNKHKISLEIVSNKALSPSLNEGEIKETGPLEIGGVIDDDSSAFVILPIGTVSENLRLVNYNILEVQVQDKNKLPETRRQIEEMGFATKYIGDTVSQINSFFIIFRVIISGFGLLAMVVAILGMINTLTVSLLERTREVGVLKSNGAKRKDIWRIFIADAIIISFIGGLLGIIIGAVTGELINFIFNIYAHKFGAEIVDFYYTPPYYVFLALLLIIMLGLIVGLYPAKRAAKINPLSALKYE